MKTIFLFNIFIVLFSSVFAASLDDGKEWLEISTEYKDEILDRLKDSKKFTQDQISVVTKCFDESSFKKVLNCFSDGGVDEASGIVAIIRDQLDAIKDRICGKKTFGNKDKCEKFGNNLSRLKNNLQGAWISTVERGKKYLEQKNKLLFLKRKICKKIDQEGCYNWLNERIKLKCNPKKLGNNPVAIENCQLNVTEEVWKRVKGR